MRPERLLLLYLMDYFNEGGDFHVGNDTFVESATVSDNALSVALLLPDGDTREVILSARTVNEGGGCS